MLSRFWSRKSSKHRQSPGGGGSFSQSHVFNAGLGLCLLGCLTFAARLSRDYAGERDQLLQPPPLVHLGEQALTMLSMGNKGLYDDFAHIWALQVYLNPELKAQPFEDVHAWIEQVRSVGIAIESFYLVSCLAYIDFDQPSYCEPLMLQGLRKKTQSWKIALLQGFVWARHLGDEVRAAYYFHRAALEPRSPPFLDELAARLGRGEQLSKLSYQESLRSAVDFSWESMEQRGLEQSGNRGPQGERQQKPLWQR